MSEQKSNDTKAVAEAPGRPQPSQFKRIARWMEHTIAGAALSVLAVFFSPLPGWLYLSMDRQNELQRADYIICLGGDPARIIEATRLLQEGWADRLVVSATPAGGAWMRDRAVEWGARPEQILIDDGSFRTADHPGSIAARVGVRPERDVCIVVTSYLHLARSQACFEKAGYRHLILREPRWEREFRSAGGWKYRFRIFPSVVYEYAAWLEYYLRGAV